MHMDVYNVLLSIINAVLVYLITLTLYTFEHNEILKLKMKQAKIINY